MPMNSPLSEKTIAEMAAGKRAVEFYTIRKVMPELEQIGVDIRGMSLEQANLNVILAQQMQVLPPPKTRRCGICFQEHEEGERCPNSARRYLATPAQRGEE